MATSVGGLPLTPSDRRRLRVLEALRRAEGPLDLAELARRVRLHPNTVRAHLVALAEAGLVSARREPRPGPGRPRMVYTAEATAGRAGDVAEYRRLAEMLAGLAAARSDAAAQAEEAGRRWGCYLTQSPPPYASVSEEEAVAVLLGLLEELGFEPELEGRGAGARVLMHRCPYLEVAERFGHVVCPLHLGIVRGALDELGSPLEVAGVDPFVESDLCVAHLARARRP